MDPVEEPYLNLKSSLNEPRLPNGTIQKSVKFGEAEPQLVNIILLIIPISQHKAICGDIGIFAYI